MSKYENYDAISENYDKTRTAVGIEIVLGYISSLHKERHKVQILDAGCGTGNYALKLKEHYPNVWCADFSMGMLNKCQQKLSLLGQQANLLRCDITKLPFRDASMDVIICNQSLHHLDEPGNQFKNLAEFLQQAARCLNSDGLLLINTITHQQLHDGVWWGDLIKPAVDRMKLRFTTEEQLTALLDQAGLAITNRVVALDTIIQQHGYFDQDSLFDKTFRDGDSHFSLLTPDELTDMLKQLSKMRNRGELANYISDRDLQRREIGQFTYYVIRKK
ncbi:methyltransferase domain-containing protein [Xenorhabdus bovienii]|uniref:class I SAM-dependent methyltransferase n=1 Tax=Xenorhabdus bovienii TaxID=40576 RepID=UPI0023B2BAC6|nr:class I SAM-dependent methyltransferase [Xenorhabdus bovienii]MDE9437867.1 methyltransferase domain-containing protein [Xenorhabdus bovienii]MDE9466902.1 methyltransferase domain-containing protein [Xenorhabdus bovienii]MDE9499649.1 methyltransferase domain-containing protein [Xenorhabdus bovienii]